MTREQILIAIETVDNKIKLLTEKRCESILCKGNEYERSLKIQDLLDERTELYYKLDHPAGVKSSRPKESPEQKARIQEKLDIAKNLLDILDDEVISVKVGLSLEAIQALRG